MSLLLIEIAVVASTVRQIFLIHSVEICVWLKSSPPARMIAAHNLIILAYDILPLLA